MKLFNSSKNKSSMNQTNNANNVNSPISEKQIDDFSYIKEIKHIQSGVWHQYEVLLDARGYSWDTMKEWADYMIDADLHSVSQVTTASLGVDETDITTSFSENGQKCANTPELEVERGVLSVAGNSKTLQAPLKIVLINQTQVLRFFTLIDDLILLEKYIETMIRRTFGTDDAMKLAKRKNEVDFSMLNPLLENGLLKVHYQDEGITIYSFLKLAYVAFVHDRFEENNENTLHGALLRYHEAEIIIRSKATESIKFLCSQEERSFVFSENTIALCNSFAGRLRLKNKIKKALNISKAENSCVDLGLDSFPEKLGTTAIKTYFGVYKMHSNAYKKHIKKVKILGTIALTSMLIFILVVGTIDFRKLFDKEREYGVFDKHGEKEIYSRIEIDALASFAILGTRNFDYYDSESHGTYYLYYSSADDSYGIVKFTETYEENNILPDDQSSIWFDEPLVLYGKTKIIPSDVDNIFDDIMPKKPAVIQLPGTTIITPDNSTIEIPNFNVSLPYTPPGIPTNDNFVTDNGKVAIDFYKQQGIILDLEDGLGKTYLSATVEKERITSPFNKTLNTSSSLFILIAVIVFIPLCIFGYKADEEAKRLRDPKLATNTLKFISPVRVIANEIHINSKNLALWVQMNNGFYNTFECTAKIQLLDPTPTITLYDDGVKTRQYVLGTKDGENFEMKYFVTSVRIGFHGEPLVPAAQIDGFITDNPEQQEITSSDIGYRMEAYFLLWGGKAGEQRYSMMRGQDLPTKALKYHGYTTPSNIRLIGICPDCGKSFTFHGYSFYMMQEDIAYSDDGLDCCRIVEYDIDKDNWSCEINGKTFRYYNSFNCPYCRKPYIDYKKHPENKKFGVSGCVHLGKKAFVSK